MKGVIFRPHCDVQREQSYLRPEPLSKFCSADFFYIQKIFTQMQKFMKRQYFMQKTHINTKN